MSMTHLPRRPRAENGGTCEEVITNPKAPRRGQVCGRPLPCQAHTRRVGDVPAAAVAEFLEEEIAKRVDEGVTDESERDKGGVGRVAGELAASGHWTVDGAARLVWSIRHHDRLYVGSAVVDRMLVALGREEVWRTHNVFRQVANEELRKAGFRVSRGVPPEAFCVKCEEWTLGERCAVCDQTTVTVEKMLERKREGRCELTGRPAPGITYGHRLCRSKQRFGRLLGRSPEVRLGLEEYVQPGIARIDPRLGQARLELLHRVYREEHIGTWTLSVMVYRQLGFPSPGAANTAILNGFRALKLEIRHRNDRRRTEAAMRRLGVGHRVAARGKGSVLTIEFCARLYRDEYVGKGESSKRIAARHYQAYGFDSPERFRNVVEHAWKRLGYKLRTTQEAQKIALKREGRRTCKAMVERNDGSKPFPCGQFPLNGSDYCLHHDPAHREEVVARARRLANRRKQTLKMVAWDRVLPHIQPLLVPRPDPKGRSRQYETASGALARHTGIDAAITSRLLKHPTERITVKRADQLLAPLGLSVEKLGIPLQGYDEQAAESKARVLVDVDGVLKDVDEVLGKAA